MGCPASSWPAPTPPLTFADGTRLGPGDVIGELHWHNEVIPQMDDQGIDLGWGLTFSRRLR